jgi:hypothetical protein
MFLIFIELVMLDHLNVGQTSEHPIDRLKTLAKPHWVSPNPNARW